MKLYNLNKKLFSLTATIVIALGLQAKAAVVDVNDASIDGDVTWSSDNEYVLNGFVFVEDGETLTIEPGTVVRGKPGTGANASALIVARGGTIIARGTAAKPIIFTAEDDDLSDPNDFGPGDVGEWGGLILLGKATLNSPEASGDPIEDNIEGIPTTEPRGRFGGSDDSDSSGVLRYVSVRHGGSNIGANNEINGVTFGGVGSGTVVEFVEVFANQDDGFEFFGGTVQAKYLVAAFCGDDSFDYDQGYRGKGQFWFTHAAGDRGGEHDGDVDDLNNLPLSNPTIYNVTYLGTNAGSGDALKLRENAAGKYYNSIFAYFGDKAVDVEADIEDDNGNKIGDDPTKNNIDSGELDLRDNIFWTFGSGNANNSSGNAQAFFTDAGRNNVFVDPQLGNYTMQLGMNPLPSAGSPALAAGRDEIGDGFFCDVNFKGAFGAVNWAAGWTVLVESGFMTADAAGVPSYPLAGSNSIVVTDSSLNGDVTWTANNEYILDGFVFVEDGESLTIEPGTVVRGKSGQGANASALIVARGGQIFANGTAENPIIFTAEDDDLTDPNDFGPGDVGEWGGLIILGKATLNSPEASGTPIMDNIEGIPTTEPRGQFGGSDDADNSGVLRYVSVRHGGSNIGANNEINGVTFGGVGSGTVVEFVEVFANQDDGFEFFGGTVQAKYLVAAFCGDDSFDYDQGYRGKGQFWFTHGAGDRGGEHDGDVDDLNNLPLSNPTIYNATYLGTNTGSGDGLKLRENAAGKYYNSIFAYFGDKAVDVEADIEDDNGNKIGDDPTKNNIDSGELDLRENIFWSFGSSNANNSSDNAQAFFTETDRNNVFADPKLGNYTMQVGMSPLPAQDSPALQAGQNEIADGFFCDVDFKGAFGGVNWAAGWTILVESGFMTNDAAGVPNYPLATDSIVTVTDASLSGDTTWTSDKEYILDGFVFVEDGETLTIEAGTVVRGKPGEGANASALIVARGGKIMAEGTADNPIIFTAEDDDLSDPNDFGPGDVGEWGGLIILGKATLNSPEASGTPIVDNIEGIPTTEPRGQFGGSDDADNSGVLRYVSVRHGGSNIGANNEINGVTFGGVGSGTTVEFVEVFANKDDGFEFFGGTVAAKYLVAAFCGDDSFDYDQGYRGKGQFWFTHGAGDRGGEHDGDVDDLNNLPLSNPTIYNVTYLGSNTGSGDALKLRENAAGKYYNSIFAYFGDKAVDIEADIEDDNGNKIGDDPTKNNITSGELDLRENIFWSFGSSNANNSSGNAQPFFTETDRNNVFTDPLINYTTQVGMSPLPGAGSPALQAGREEIEDGFFCDVSFKGAFGSVNWAAGWTILVESGFMTNASAGIPDYPLFVDTTVEVTDASLSGDTTWTADKEYILDGFVFVEDGETLTIEPGTVIRGMPGEGANASALIVARGGKIMAEGTPEAPIIFTALDDDLSDPNDFGPGDVGEWGGLIILGKATLNSPEASGTPIVDNIEGIPTTEPRGQFGGSDDADNSGVLRYVSVRHGGSNIGANNEINGVTFGGVGSGTTVEFVEVFANKDDGFEFFGGTVAAKYLVAAFCGDDSFDYDQGYRGKGQFWFTHSAGDRGGEHDGDVDDLNNLPLSNPTIYNVTYLGSNTGSGDALKLRENAAGKYYNSVFAYFGDKAVDVEADIEDDNGNKIGDDPTKNNIASGELDLRENIFWAFGSSNDNSSSGNAQSFFTETDRNNIFVDPLLGNYTNGVGLDPLPQFGSPALIGGLDEIEDGFFCDVNFKGAFGAINWASGWTILVESGFMTNDSAGTPDYPLYKDSTVDQVVVNTSITSDVTWTADKEYVLDGFIFVEDGATLTIDAGTIIRGNPGQGANASALVVARGGKIMAEGTAADPIIFTALDDDLSDPNDFGPGDVGEWGGLILLGKATLNSPEASGTPIVDNIEGIPSTEPRGQFGGTDDNDNSGVLRYISVRHGGSNIGANNEINGVTFGGVGRGTTVEFIEVYANQDDGFEFFGGTVEAKFLIATFCGDDSFDYDQGYRGKGQFWFTHAAGDRGGEHDGDVDDLNNLPLSNPTIYNVTYLGTNTGSGDGLKLRENSAGKYYNSIFAYFGDKAVDVEADIEDDNGNKIGDDPTKNNITSGELDLRDNIFWSFGSSRANSSSDNAQAFFTETDRNNVFVDPQLSNYTLGLGMLPIPLPGSPALGSGRDEIADGFFCDVNFKGAFGDINWASGWTAVVEAGFMAPNGAGTPNYPLAKEGATVLTDASIDGDTTLTADQEYILEGFVFVEDGETLTIEPGTIIRGNPGQGANASALIVARGGKIMAEGTAADPIIFTALDDDLSDPNDFGPGDVGEWGGLIILGKARLNSPRASGIPIEDNIEGIPTTEPRGRFGGLDDDDNSGVLRYVSVRHGGSNIGANNEINGVTFGGVGRGTTVEFIEVYANQDDGFEFFGGTVEAKFLVATFCGDDSFDYDQGYRGKGQFWFTHAAGDRGGEHDGDVDDFNNLPLSNPTIYNVTYLGTGEGSGDALKLRENSAGKYYNSIFAYFGDKAVDVEADIEDDNGNKIGDDPTKNNITSGELDLRDNIFWSFGSSRANSSSDNAQAFFTETDRNNVFVDPQLGNYTLQVGMNPLPAAGSPALGSGRDEIADGFFCDVNFKGAFGAINWAAGWTIIVESGFMTEAGAGIPDYPTKVDAADPEIEVSLSEDKSNLTLGVQSQSGKSYTLQSLSDLGEGNAGWSDVEVKVGDGGEITFTVPVDNSAGDRAIFFRIDIQ